MSWSRSIMAGKYEGSLMFSPDWQVYRLVERRVTAFTGNY